MSMSDPYLSPYYLIPALLVLATPLVLYLRSASSSSAIPKMVSHKQHTIVVLGAGFVGVPLVHHLLKYTPSTFNIRIILVSPNDSFYINTAAVRGILPSEYAAGGPGIVDYKLFYKLGAAFEASSTIGGHAGDFEHVLGRATRLDPDNNCVDVCLNGGTAFRTIAYDSIVVATGSDMNSGMPFKTVAGGGTRETKEALQSYRDKIRAAKSIVVAGGGQTGIELAAELGHAFGKKGIKEVTLVMSGSLPSVGPNAKESIRKSTDKQLQKMGVKIVRDSRVTSFRNVNGRTEVTLETKGSGGTKGTKILTTDVYLPALGETFNTQFLPESTIDTSATGRRRVRVRPTFQMEGYDNVFVAGDVANLQQPSIKYATDQLLVLAPQLQTYLQNWALDNGGGPGEKKPLATFKPITDPLFALSLGPNGGIGQAGTMKLPSFIIWFFKSRTLGVQRGPDYAAGRRTMATSKW